MRKSVITNINISRIRYEEIPKRFVKLTLNVTI